MPKSDQTAAVVGAGIGGLSCARQLREAGYRVHVFDKGRDVGGRISVRHAMQGAAFDHGAQYFTVKGAAMAAQVELWKHAGIVAAWEARIGSLRASHWTPSKSETTRYVGVPGMSAIAKHLATDLDVVLQCRVTKVTRNEGDWRLTSDEGRDLGAFDLLILNAPSAQSATLVCEFPKFAEQINTATMAPCWVAMLAFEERLDVPWDGAFVDDSPLSWIARNSSKPGRSAEPDCWVLHANPEWSTRCLEESRDAAVADLVASFWEATGLSPRAPLLTSAHRWRFALPTETLEERCLLDGELRLGACGDWCGGPRVEGAFLSGLAMAEAVQEII